MEKMKNLLTMALGLLLTACSITEGVPEGDQLYTGLTKLKYENYEPCDHADLMKEEMENSLATAPNGALFGSSRFRFPLPVNLLIWNAYHKSETDFGKWMASSFGKEPVLMSRVNPELRATVARSVLRSHGYFNANVTHLSAERRISSASISARVPEHNHDCEPKACKFNDRVPAPAAALRLCDGLFAC